MTTDHDVDRLTAQFLRDGPAELADRVLEAALDEVHVTRQRRRVLASWRNLTMSSLSLRIAAIVAVLAVGGFAILTIGRSSTVIAPATPAPSFVAPTPGLATPPASALASPGASLLAPTGYAGGGTIAFTRHDPSVGGDAPFLIDPSGSNETRIPIQHGWPGATVVPQTGCCAVFSPDGTQVAVGYEELNPNRGPGTMAATQVFSLAGASSSLVPSVCGGCGSINGIEFVPRAWSATPNQLALEVTSAQDPTREGIDLAPMDSAAQPPTFVTQVTGNHPDRPIAFSPDGSRLLFVRQLPDQNTGELWVLVVASGATRRVSPAGALVFADDYLAPSASWSPDGKRIAFAATDASGDTSQMRVYVVDANGGTPAVVTDPSSFSTTAAWSPDGTWIAFDRDMANSHHHVFVVHPDGSGLRDLAPKASFGECCSHWAPDGSAVVAPGTESTDAQSVLMVLPTDGSGARQVTTVPGYYTGISWGPASR
jgi:hypothetical protein